VEEPSLFGRDTPKYDMEVEEVYTYESEDDEYKELETEPKRRKLNDVAAVYQAWKLSEDPKLRKHVQMVSKGQTYRMMKEITCTGTLPKQEYCYDLLRNLNVRVNNWRESNFHMNKTVRFHKYTLNNAMRELKMVKEGTYVTPAQPTTGNGYTVWILTYGKYGLPPVMLVSLHEEIGEDIILDLNFQHLTKKLALDTPHVEEGFRNNPEVLERQCENMIDLERRGCNTASWKPGAVSTKGTTWDGKVHTETYTRDGSHDSKRVFEDRILFQNLSLVSHQYPRVVSSPYVNPHIPVSLTEVDIQYREALKKHVDYKAPEPGAKYCGKECEGFIPVAAVRGYLHELNRKKTVSEREAQRWHSREIEHEASLQRENRAADDQLDADAYRRGWEEANRHRFYNVHPLTRETQGATYAIDRNDYLMDQAPGAVQTPRTRNGRGDVSTSTSRDTNVQTYFGSVFVRTPSALRRRSDDEIMTDAMLVVDRRRRERQMSPATAVARAQARTNAQIRLADINPYYNQVEVSAAMQPNDGEMPALNEGLFDSDSTSDLSMDDNSTCEYRSDSERWLYEQANATHQMDFHAANLIEDSPSHEAQNS